MPKTCISVTLVRSPTSEPGVKTLFFSKRMSRPSFTFLSPIANSFERSLITRTFFLAFGSGSQNTSSLASSLSNMAFPPYALTFGSLAKLLSRSSSVGS